MAKKYLPVYIASKLYSNMRLIFVLLVVALILGCIKSTHEETVTTYTTLVPTTTTTIITPAVEEGFEVHEWGVLVGCINNDSYFLTSRPEQLVFVKQPVIYVHSKQKNSFNVRVIFNNGKPTDTYPQAEMEGNSAVWRDVTFSECNKAGSKAPPYVPLEQILGTLNNVDSYCLSYGSKDSRFLFYEGEMKFENKVTATYSFETKKATLENNGNHQVYNVVVAASKESSQIFSPDIYTATIDRLNPGEEKTVEFEKQKEVNLTEDLMIQGFTSMEANAFSNLWRGPMLYPSNTVGWANLIYRLSEEEYNQMITLKIEPKPEKTIRTLYVLIHLKE